MSIPSAKLEPAHAATLTLTLTSGAESRVAEPGALGLGRECVPLLAALDGHPLGDPGLLGHDGAGLHAGVCTNLHLGTAASSSSAISRASCAARGDRSRRPATLAPS